MDSGRVDAIEKDILLNIFLVKTKKGEAPMKGLPAWRQKGSVLRGAAQGSIFIQRGLTEHFLRVRPSKIEPSQMGRQAVQKPGKRGSQR